MQESLERLVKIHILQWKLIERQINCYQRQPANQKSSLCVQNITIFWPRSGKSSGPRLDSPVWKETIISLFDVAYMRWDLSVLVFSD